LWWGGGWLNGFAARHPAILRARPLNRGCMLCGFDYQLIGFAAKRHDSRG